MNKQRISVLLAFVTNPFLAVYQKKIYEKYWKDEIDELLISVNGRNDQMREFIYDLWKNDDKLVRIENIAIERRQGSVFNDLYQYVNGDILMTLDSDNFIYKKGVIDELVAPIRGGAKDAVGSVGNHAHPWANARILIEKNGCVRMNPFMSFFRKSIIDEISDLDFRSASLKKDEYSDLFQGCIPEDGHIDVMGPFSIKFFQKSLKYTKIPPVVVGQYIHMYGISSIFRRNFKRMEDTNDQKFDEKQATRQDLGYWANYKLLYDATKADIPFSEYNKEYEKAFEYQLNKSSLTMSDVKNEVNKIKKIHNGLI